jgi:hypothetical protein
MKIVHTITAVLLFVLIQSSALNATPFLIINEVFYDEVGGDGSNVFTELYGEPGLELNNWSLIGINGSNGSAYLSFNLSGFVLDTGLFVLNGTDWQNGPDAVHLVYHDVSTDLDILVDALQYGDAGDENYGEGQFALDVSPGSSLARKAPGLDTNNNFSDFIVLDTPTPGMAPAEASVPEPGSLTLLLLGLTGLMFHTKTKTRKRPSTIL